VSWWCARPDAAAVQALQIELAEQVLHAKALADWVRRIHRAFFACLPAEVASGLKGFSNEPWPIFKDRQVTKDPGGGHFWSRQIPWGRALIVTAGLNPCRQCGAPPGPEPKRCWECQASPGILGFLRKGF
jgi:hypothetical protein